MEYKTFKETLQDISEAKLVKSTTAEEEIKLLRKEIKLLRKERDEARRMYSEQKARTASTDAHDSPEYASAIAFNKGWDCYDKK